MPEMAGKQAAAEEPILDVIRDRWSPRAFDPAPIPRATLRVLFEAARWAASCFNEQPWRYIVADTEPARARAAAVLVAKNQQWARGAPVLACVAARLAFERNDRPNRHALYDAGAATAQLALQAASMGIFVHQMAGFDGEGARGAFAIPEGFEPIAMMAIGRLGDPASLPGEFREKEISPRARKSQSEFVYAGRWGEPWRAA